jgi:hypothetical protein
MSQTHVYTMDVPDTRVYNGCPSIGIALISRVGVSPPPLAHLVRGQVAEAGARGKALGLQLAVEAVVAVHAAGFGGEVGAGALARGDVIGTAGVGEQGAGAARLAVRHLERTHSCV